MSTIKRILIRKVLFLRYHAAKEIDIKFLLLLQEYLNPDYLTRASCLDILIHAAIWPQQIWAENWGWGCAPLGRESWFPT